MMCTTEADQNTLSITAAADGVARGEKLERETKLISTISHGKFLCASSNSPNAHAL